MLVIFTKDAVNMDDSEDTLEIDTDADDEAHITGSCGYFVFVNFTCSYMNIEHRSVSSIMVDGIKLHVHDRRPETKMLEGWTCTTCAHTGNR